MPRENADTGIRFASWGPTNDRFYTGSSDGIVKAWNVKLASEEALVRDVVQLDTGVMSGSFSPDYTQLLLGDSMGGINLLTVGLDDFEAPEPPRAFLFQPSMID